MVKPGKPSRGEVWIVELDPTVGTEIRKTRPCLVVSPDRLNRIFELHAIVPMTSGNRAAPFRVPVWFNGVEGLILTEQVRSVSRRRMRNRVGTLPDDVVRSTLDILQEMFAE